MEKEALNLIAHNLVCWDEHKCCEKEILRDLVMIYNLGIHRSINATVDSDSITQACVVIENLLIPTD